MRSTFPGISTSTIRTLAFHTVISILIATIASLTFAMEIEKITGKVDKPGYALDADPPTKPDAEGRYPMPTPGVTKFV